MLEIDKLGKTYEGRRQQTAAIDSLSFGVAKGEFLCIVGPSGCGKTTLLKCMAGLLRPTTGAVRLHGRAVSEPPAEMAVVFQDYSRSLFPWMTIGQNVVFPLKRKALGSQHRDRLVADALDSVGLAEFAGHYPWQLSGGMQQRVAIARAVAYQPEILLMDEPFASVDAQTRADLEDLVLRVRSEYGMTVVFVTHDIDESVYLGDRVVVLTRPPTTVQELLTVDLPAPRNQVLTKELPRFAELRGHVYMAIRGGAQPALVGASR